MTDKPDRTKVSKAVDLSTAARLHECVEVQKFGRSSDSRGHTYGPVTDDHVFRNGKAIATREENMSTGLKTYSVNVNGMDYFVEPDPAHSGKDLISRGGKMDPIVQVKNGSKEYKSVHKVLDSIAWNHLPVCKIER